MAETQDRPTAVARVARRTLSQRRRRVWRELLLLGVGTVIMVIVAMANRDYQAVENARTRMERVAAYLQKLHNNKRPFPLEIPMLKGDDAEARELYLYNSLFTDSLLRRREVAVCYRIRPMRLFLRTDGNFVLVFDGKNFRVEWLTVDEAHEKADDYGMRLFSTE